MIESCSECVPSANRRRRRTTDHFVDEHVVPERQTAAADFFRMTERPQALRLRFFHQPLHRRAAAVAIGFEEFPFPPDRCALR